MRGLPKDWRELVKAARRSGWRVKETRTGKVKLLSPDGENIVVLHRTPHGGKRGLENERARLKRMGVKGL